MINDLTTGSVAKQLIMFALPLMLSNLLQTVYNIVDMIVVGQFVGSTGLSAVSIGGDLLNLCTHIVTGFAGAGQIMIAQYVGQKDREAVSRTIGTMFTFILGLAVVMMAGMLTFSDRILELMNTPAESYQQAKDYSVVCYWGMVFIFGYNTVSSILRGMGDSKRPFIFIGAAALINLVLDLIFVAVLHMDAYGAALATIMGQAFSFIGSLVYLFIKRESFGFDFKASSFRLDLSKLWPLLRLGFPMALQHAAITLSMLFVNSYVNSFGLVASAVTGVGNKLRSAMGIISNSINTASSAMVGQNMGAKKPERVKQLVHVDLAICMTAFVILASVALIFPEALFSLFNDDPAILEWAPKYMITFVVAILSFATMAPYNSVINGIGHASLGFIIAMADGVFCRIGLALLLGIVFDMGIFGLWMGNALAGFSTVIPAMIYYYSGRWQRRKLLVE